jgi:CPA1 family monovalent cation:H+ antiporter
MTPFDLFAGLLLVAAVAGFVNQRWLRLPQPIGLLVIALALSAVMMVTGRLLGAAGPRTWLAGTLAAANLPRVLFNGALGFMLFAGALHLNLRDLRNHALPVLALATVGVVLATGFYGVAVLFVFRLVGATVPLIWCLVLGASMAPTDPIAVGGLLRSAGLPPDLLAVITGESLFNDGAAVVLFTVLLGIATGTHAGGAITPVGLSVLFLRAILGGALLGFAGGSLGSLAITLIDDYDLEITISLAVVSTIYVAALRIGASAPIAVVVAGIVIGNHQRGRSMSVATRANVTLFWSLVDQLLNTLLFLLMGLELLTIDTRHFWPGLIALASLLALLARFVSVALAALLVRSRRLLSLRALTVLTWCGLRGGVSVALALSLPSVAARAPLLEACYGVAVFTIVVQGLTVPSLIRRLYGVRPGAGAGAGAGAE